MILKDLIALAKAGYTPAAVKELLTMDADNKAEAEEAPAAVPKEETQPDVQNAETEGTSPTLTEDIVKALEKQVQELKNELESNKQKLQEAQQSNTTADLSTGAKTETKEQALANIVRGFM